MSILQGLFSALAGRDLHWRGQSALVSHSKCTNFDCDYGNVDVDECLPDTGRLCAPNAVCHNRVGSYHCRCQKGYVGDGKQCCVSWYELWQYIDRGE